MARRRPLLFGRIASFANHDGGIVSEDFSDESAEGIDYFYDAAQPGVPISEPSLADVPVFAEAELSWHDDSVAPVSSVVDGETILRPLHVAPTAVGEAVVEPPAASPTAGGRQRSRRMVVAAVLMLLVLGAVGAWWGTRDDSTSTRVEGVSVSRSPSTVSVSTESSLPATVASDPQTTVVDTSAIPATTLPDAAQSPTTAAVAAVLPTTASGAKARSVPTTAPVAGPHSNPSPAPTPTATAANPATPNPTGSAATVAISPQRITCDAVTAPIVFSPGLNYVKVAQTFVLNSTTSLVKNCVDASGRGITSGVVQNVDLGFGAIDCTIGAGNGTGTGQIKWSNGAISGLKLRIDIQQTYVGTATWTITSGPFVGAVASSSVSILLGQDVTLGCLNRITVGTLAFGQLQLVGA